MAELVYPAPFRALDANGAPIAEAEATFFETDSTTPLVVYADEAGSSAHPSPLVADANGLFPAIFHTGGTGVKVDVRHPTTGASLPGYPINLSIATSTTTGAADDITFSPTSDVPATNVQSAIQIAATAARSFEFIATADASSTATIDFTQFDPARFDAYMFVVQNLIPATDGGDLVLRTSSNGGSGYDGGGSDYQWAYNVARPTSGAATTGDTADSFIMIAPNVGAGSGEDGVSGTIMIYGPHLARRTQIKTDVLHEDATGEFRVTSGGGLRLSSTDVNAVRFYFATGNIQNGTITMYGLRNG